MSIAIGSSSAKYAPPVQTSTVQTANKPVDSDGDNDGSKAGEVERPKATTGSIGTIIDTKA